MDLFYFILFLFLIFMTVVFLTKKLIWPSTVHNFHKKHVVVTGGSSGIGKAVAIEAAKFGADVTIIARNVQRLELAVKEIKDFAKNPGFQKINHLSLDVSKSSMAIEEALNSLENDVGPIFMFINCAGLAVCGTVVDATESDFKYMMDLNFYGTVFPTMAVAKKMMVRKQGHIVITGSQASLLGIYGMSAYCSSKFALRGFAESLHMELKPYNVAVTLSLPPDTDTPGFKNEENSKPEITKLISETAGLFEPNHVASQLLNDSINHRFFSIVGFESFVLTTLCSGMSPITSIFEVVLQILLMSILKLISIGYLLKFQNIIYKSLKCKDLNDKTQSVKLE